MEADKTQSIIESLLFVSGEPVSLKKIINVTGLNKEEIQESIKALAKRYEDSCSGLMLLEKKEELQLVSKADNVGFVEKLIKNELQDSLSGASLEVLSIIAYRGPVSKTEIEAIRGVNCSYTVRNLLMRGLIERNDNPNYSRGYVYEISFDFLKKIGLESVEKLPQYDILSKDERVEDVINKEQ